MTIDSESRNLALLSRRLLGDIVVPPESGFNVSTIGNDLTHLRNKTAINSLTKRNFAENQDDWRYIRVALEHPQATVELDERSAEHLLGALDLLLA
jgi:hypothetical protein